jgi:hypothetical protein
VIPCNTFEKLTKLKLCKILGEEYNTITHFKYYYYAKRNSCHQEKELHRKLKTRQSLQATGYDATANSGQGCLQSARVGSSEHCSARKAIFHSTCETLPISLENEKEIMKGEKKGIGKVDHCR